MISQFQPRNKDFEAKVRNSFKCQEIMKTLKISISAIIAATKRYRMEGRVGRPDGSDEESRATSYRT